MQQNSPRLKVSEPQIVELIKIEDIGGHSIESLNQDLPLIIMTHTL